MNSPLEPYGASLSLLTDLYQLTMAQGYWKSGTDRKEAVFHLFYRKNPFGGGFAIACGLHYVVDYLRRLQFDPGDLAYLAGLTGNDGKPLFEGPFLEHLANLKFSFSVDAVPEGTVVFPHEPLVRVQGPILQCQIIETPLLNLINFQTLIATKAARICMAARGEPVLEFGLRRAHGIDGALSASRAAYVGGCASTSNVLAGKLFGIPVKGTHSHSWVMSFDDEIEAFETYADAMPNNCIFLVDTYDTLQGVRRAAEVGKKLRQRGHEMIGIRLDSGDLAYLSIEARRILDAAGFPDAVIVASNDLDEKIIDSLKEQGATICVWGVGTRLATAYDEPALGGVFKLAAVRPPGGEWEFKVKLSEQTIKTTIPGIQQVRRFHNTDSDTDSNEFLADMIYNSEYAPAGDCEMYDPMDPTHHKQIPEGTPYDDLLVPVFRDGVPAYKAPSIHHVRQRAQDQLTRFHPGIKRFVHPHRYPVGLENGLHELRNSLILKARNENR